MKNRGFGHVDEVKDVVEPVIEDKEPVADTAIEVTDEAIEAANEEDVTEPVTDEPVIEEAAEDKPADDSLVEVAKDVLAGKYGNDAERRRKLTEKGYDPEAVQALVNKMIP